MAKNLWIDYHLRIGDIVVTKFQIFKRVFYFLLFVMLVSLLMGLCNREEKVHKGDYYVTGLYTSTHKKTHIEKKLYYIATKERIDPDKKIRLYNYHFIPCDAVNKNMIHEIGSKITVTNPTSSMDIKSSDVTGGFMVITFFCIFIVLIMIGVLMYF